MAVDIGSKCRQGESWTVCVALPPDKIHVFNVLPFCRKSIPNTWQPRNIVISQWIMVTSHVVYVFAPIATVLPISDTQFLYRREQQHTATVFREIYHVSLTWLSKCRGIQVHGGWCRLLTMPYSKQQQKNDFTPINNIIVHSVLKCFYCCLAQSARTHVEFDQMSGVMKFLAFITNLLFSRPWLVHRKLYKYRFVQQWTCFFAQHSDTCSAIRTYIYISVEPVRVCFSCHFGGKRHAARLQRNWTYIFTLASNYTRTLKLLNACFLSYNLSALWLFFFSVVVVCFAAHFIPALDTMFLFCF